jgi:hypothetical protein
MESSRRPQAMVPPPPERVVEEEEAIESKGQLMAPYQEAASKKKRPQGPLCLPPLKRGLSSLLCQSKSGSGQGGEGAYFGLGPPF